VGWLTLYFELIGEISDTETIVIDKSIREIERLKKTYGAGRWRKMKGKVTVRFADGTICKAEAHWYEAHGIGKKEIKIKHVL